MPTYQYTCTACAEPLEAVQSFTDAPLTECPACGGLLRKVFSAVGVVFKGSGFYKTDSRAAATGGGEGSAGKDGAEAKPAAADAKPAKDGGGKDGSSSATPAKASPAKDKPAASAKPASSTSTPAAKSA